MLAMKQGKPIIDNSEMSNGRAIQSLSTENPQN